MPLLIPDPAYMPPSLTYILGEPPTPNLTVLGGGLFRIKFPKNKLQDAVWDFLKVGEHYVVNLDKCSSGLISAKNSDATFYYIEAQADPTDVWEDGDSVVPQIQKWFVHTSNLKIASMLARERDYILGWRDDGTYGVIKQADAYTEDDANALSITPGEDINSHAMFDLQKVRATGKLINICRHGDPKMPMNGISDNGPVLEVIRNQDMIIKQAIDAYEDMVAERNS